MDRIALRALAPRLEDLYPNCAAFDADLSAYLAARYPERWRAVAPMSGPFVDGATYPFYRIRQLPIFMTEGTSATPSLS